MGCLTGSQGVAWERKQSPTPAVPVGLGKGDFDVFAVAPRAFWSDQLVLEQADLGLGQALSQEATRPMEPSTRREAAIRRPSPLTAPVDVDHG